MVFEEWDIVRLYAIGIVISWGLVIIAVRREAKYWWSDVITSDAQYEHLRGLAVSGFVFSFFWGPIVLFAVPAFLLVWADKLAKKAFMKSYN